MSSKESWEEKHLGVRSNPLYCSLSPPPSTISLDGEDQYTSNGGTHRRVELTSIKDTNDEIMIIQSPHPGRRIHRKSHPPRSPCNQPTSDQEEGTIIALPEETIRKLSIKYPPESDNLAPPRSSPPPPGKRLRVAMIEPRIYVAKRRLSSDEH